MKDYNTIYVGIDAHKNEHFMYIIDPQNSTEMRCTVQNNAKELQRFISRMLKKFKDPKLQIPLDDLLYEVERCIERVKKLEQEIEQIAQSETYREKVGWLRCFRGIDTVTAMVILSELYGFERFNDLNQLMAFLGLTPSENSSGVKTRRGSITKSGNKRVRRILVESSWHQRHRPQVGKALSKRRAGQPAWVIAAADKADAAPS